MKKIISVECEKVYLQLNVCTQKMFVAISNILQGQMDLCLQDSLWEFVFAII